MLAECAAVAAFLLWQWLPLYRYTSAMGDRELLMVLAVIFFVLVTFPFMLNSLVRISTPRTLRIEIRSRNSSVARTGGKRAAASQISYRDHSAITEVE